MMAAQVTVELGTFFLMAFDTELHLKINGAKAIHRRDVAMTPQAIYFSPLNMRLVPEFYEIRDKVYAYPRNGNPLIQVLLFFHDFRMHRDNIFMAEEAFLDLRKSGMFGTLDIGMAKAAVDLLDPGMNPVAEIDRLTGSDTRVRKYEIKVEQRSQEQDAHAEPPFPPYRLPFSIFAAFSHFSSIGNSQQYQVRVPDRTPRIRVSAALKPPSNHMHRFFFRL
jgi:hypothetical protein